MDVYVPPENREPIDIHKNFIFTYDFSYGQNRRCGFVLILSMPLAKPPNLRIERINGTLGDTRNRQILCINRQLFWRFSRFVPLLFYWIFPPAPDSSHIFMFNSNRMLIV